MMAVRSWTPAGSSRYDRTERLRAGFDRGRAVRNRGIGIDSPNDLDGTILSEYNNLESRWHDWDGVRAVCARAATVIFDHRCDLDEPAIPNA